MSQVLGALRIGGQRLGSFLRKVVTKENAAKLGSSLAVSAAIPEVLDQFQKYPQKKPSEYYRTEYPNDHELEELEDELYQKKELNYKNMYDEKY